MIYLLHRLTIWNYRRKARRTHPRYFSTGDIIALVPVVLAVLYFGAHVVWYFIR